MCPCTLSLPSTLGYIPTTKEVNGQPLIYNIATDNFTISGSGCSILKYELETSNEYTTNPYIYTDTSGMYTLDWTTSPMTISITDEKFRNSLGSEIGYIKVFANNG